MKLTVAYREQSTGTLSRVKHHFVAFHVDFSAEERAVIQERGMDNQFISVPSDTPPPTRGGDFLAMMMRIIAILAFLIGIALSIPGNSNLAAFLVVGGIILFVVGKMKDKAAYKREANPEQKLTLKRMLLNPDFVVFAETLGEAKSAEAEVKETLALTAQALRENTVRPEQASYEL